MIAEYHHGLLARDGGVGKDQRRSVISVASDYEYWSCIVLSEVFCDIVRFNDFAFQLLLINSNSN